MVRSVHPFARRGRHRRALYLQGHPARRRWDRHPEIHQGHRRRGHRPPQLRQLRRGLHQSRLLFRRRWGRVGW
jgi:hypothetical protein